MERTPEFTRGVLFIYSDHHRMIEMAESKRSGDEVRSIIADIIMATSLEDIPFQFSLIYKNLLRNISILSMIEEN